MRQTKIESIVGRQRELEALLGFARGATPGGDGVISRTPHNGEKDAGSIGKRLSCLYTLIYITSIHLYYPYTLILPIYTYITPIHLYYPYKLILTQLTYINPKHVY